MLRFSWSKPTRFAIKRLLKLGIDRHVNISEIALSRRLLPQIWTNAYPDAERNRRRKAEANMSARDKRELERWREMFYQQYNDLIAESQLLKQSWEECSQREIIDHQDEAYVKWTAIMTTIRAMKREIELWPEHPELQN